MHARAKNSFTPVTLQYVLSTYRLSPHIQYTQYTLSVYLTLLQLTSSAQTLLSHNIFISSLPRAVAGTSYLLTWIHYHLCLILSIKPLQHEVHPPRMPSPTRAQPSLHPSRLLHRAPLPLHPSWLLQRRAQRRSTKLRPFQPAGDERCCSPSSAVRQLSC